MLLEAATKYPFERYGDR